MLGGLQAHPRQRAIQRDKRVARLLDMFPKANFGFHADVETKGHHLRLFSEETTVDPVSAVFDVKAKKWVSREWADDLEDGKRKALEIAEAFIKQHPLPTVGWKKYPS